MEQEILKNNLAKINVEVDLFGNEHKKLSMADRIGFIPVSVWKPDWGIVNTLKPIIGDTGETRQLVGDKMNLMGSKYETSIFNPHLAQMILSAYCPSNARIFDPFAGGGTRGFIATAMGHEYFGFEIRQEEVDRIKAHQRKLENEFTIICADSCKKPPENVCQTEEFDFCYTCPPYYNLEVYSKTDGDISNAPTYQGFLDSLYWSIFNTYQVLKPGSLAVWVVGNFRDKGGNLIHFNGDLVRLANDAGFRLHDELIFWGAAGIAASRAGQFAANRKSVRVHEYIIVLKKP